MTWKNVEERGGDKVKNSVSCALYSDDIIDNMVIIQITLQ